MASSFSQARQGEDRFEKWMEQLPEELHNVPLCQLAVPGSHDSCTYDLQDDFFSPDASNFLKVTDIIRNYAKCQDLSISAQLQAGIRYFDFRVAFRKKDDDFYFCHTLYGPKVSDVLKEVGEFLDQHKQEVVLLDFNHFYAMNDHEHERLRVIVEERLSEKIYHRSGNTKAGELTLRHILDAKNQVIVFYTDMPDKERFKFWPSPKYTWADTMDVKTCLKTLTEKAKNRDKTDFYVSQAVLTPGGGTIAFHLLSSVRDQCAEKINPKLKKWMQKFKKGQNAGMIYFADFVDTYNFIQNVLSLNHPD